MSDISRSYEGPDGPKPLLPPWDNVMTPDTPAPTPERVAELLLHSTPDGGFTTAQKGETLAALIRGEWAALCRSWLAMRAENDELHGVGKWTENDEIQWLRGRVAVLAAERISLIETVEQERKNRFESADEWHASNAALSARLDAATGLLQEAKWHVSAGEDATDERCRYTDELCNRIDAFLAAPAPTEPK